MAGVSGRSKGGSSRIKRGGLTTYSGLEIKKGGPDCLDPPGSAPGGWEGLMVGWGWGWGLMVGWVHWLVIVQRASALAGKAQRL
jgi:hypothetical protein